MRTIETESEGERVREADIEREAETAGESEGEGPSDRTPDIVREREKE